MDSTNLLLTCVFKNEKVFNITQDVLDHYREERTKVIQNISFIKQTCKTDWNVFMKTDQNLYQLVIDMMILDAKIKEQELNLRKAEKNRRLFCNLQLVGTFCFKKISNKQKKQLVREPCSICYETHKIIHVLSTKCGHHFGECCFGKYIDNKLDNNYELNCPLCRSNNILPVVKYY
jgi:hypothetical protein